MAETANDNALIEDALDYVDSYVKKNPDVLAQTYLPNESDDFDFDIYKQSVKTLSEPYCKAVGG